MSHGRARSRAAIDVLVHADHDDGRDIHVRAPEGLRQLGAEHRRQPAVRDLGRLLDRLRSHRAEVDRDLLLHRPGQQPERLAEPRAALDRQLELLAPVLERPLARERGPDDLHVLAGACERARERHTVPALRHLRPGHSESEPEAPAGQNVERDGAHRRHRGRPPGNLHEAGAERHALRDRAQMAEHRDHILTPRLGHPDRVEPGAIGLAGQGDLLLRREPGPVGQK